MNYISSFGNRNRTEYERYICKKIYDNCIIHPSLYSTFSDNNNHDYYHGDQLIIKTIDNIFLPIITGSITWNILNKRGITGGLHEINCTNKEFSKIRRILNLSEDLRIFLFEKTSFKFHEIRELVILEDYQKELYIICELFDIIKFKFLEIAEYFVDISVEDIKKIKDEYNLIKKEKDEYNLKLNIARKEYQTLYENIKKIKGINKEDIEEFIRIKINKKFTIITLNIEIDNLRVKIQDETKNIFKQEKKKVDTKLKDLKIKIENKRKKLDIFKKERNEYLKCTMFEMRLFLNKKNGKEDLIKILDKEINIKEENIKKILNISEEKYKIYLENKEDTDKYLCKICFANEIDCFLDCGHTYCTICINQISNKTCSFCRKHFNKYKPIFLS